MLVQIQHVNAHWLMVQKRKVLFFKPPFSFISISRPISISYYHGSDYISTANFQNENMKYSSALISFAFLGVKIRV